MGVWRETRSNSSAALATVVGKVRTIISFKGSNELLRASPVTNVLRHRADIFSDHAGSAETYALSSPCRCIDVFISHNWVVGRVPKFLVLSYYFNRRMATLASLALHAALVCCSAAGFLPTVKVPWSKYPRGLACRALWNPTFLFLLYFGGDIRGLLRLQGPSVFLDKTCIHQTDLEVQRQGILRLGAFLRHSRRMLVIYTDQYLIKLWTVFEFACFLSLHPISDVRLIPTTQPRSVYVALCLNSLLLPLELLAEYFAGVRYSLAVLVMLFTPLLCFSFRREARERHAMHLRFQSFSVTDCTCACEEDRPIVYGKIAQLVRATKLAPTAASEEEALVAFSEAARAKLPALVEAGMGRVGHKYSELLTMSVGVSGSYFLDELVGLWYGMTWRELLVAGLVVSTLVFALIPMSLAGMAVAVRRCIGLRGLRELLLLCAVAWANVALVVVIWLGLEELYHVSSMAQSGEDVLWPVFVVAMLLTALCACAALSIFASPGTLSRLLCRRSAIVGWQGKRTQQEVEEDRASAPLGRSPKGDEPRRGVSSSSSTAKSEPSSKTFGTAGSA